MCHALGDGLHNCIAGWGSLGGCALFDSLEHVATFIGGVASFLVFGGVLGYNFGQDCMLTNSKKGHFMAETTHSTTTFVSDEDVLAEIAAKHVKKLARVIDDFDLKSSNRSADSKLPGKDLGKEMLSQQITEKSQIDDIIRE